MAIFSLIFFAAVAFVVSTVPDTFSEDIREFEFNDSDHVMIPFPTLPEYDYVIEGENNDHNGGNQNEHQRKICRPSEAQKNVAGMDAWCNANCFHDPPYCPESHCQCY